MKKTVEIDINEDEVVVASLEDTLAYVEDCIFSCEYPDHQSGWMRNLRIFSSDPVEDLKQLKKFRKALKKVLSWYTV